MPDQSTAHHLVSIVELASADVVLQKLQITLRAEGRRRHVAAVYTVRQLIFELIHARREELEVVAQELGIERAN